MPCLNASCMSCVGEVSYASHIHHSNVYFFSAKMYIESNRRRQRDGELQFIHFSLQSHYNALQTSFNCANTKVRERKIPVQCIVNIHIVLFSRSGFRQTMVLLSVRCTKGNAILTASSLSQTIPTVIYRVRYFVVKT